MVNSAAIQPPAIATASGWQRAMTAPAWPEMLAVQAATVTGSPVLVARSTPRASVASSEAEPR